MKKQSKGISKRLRTLINNAMFITLTANNWEIESILYIYKYEEDSNL
jgi:hypothetical protein